MKLKLTSNPLNLANPRQRSAPTQPPTPLEAAPIGTHFVLAVALVSAAAAAVLVLAP